MAGVAAEDLQRATCASLSMVFAQIATVEEMIDRICQAPPGPRRRGGYDQLVAAAADTAAPHSR